MIANLLRIQTPDIRVFMVAGLAAMTFAIMREFAVVTVLPMLLLVPFLSPFRVSPFELTVPITASQVFTARLVTSLLAMMTPIAVWIVAWLVRDPATFSPDIVVALLLLLVVSLDLGRIRAVNRYPAFRYTESAAFVLLLAAMFGPGLYYGQYSLEIVPALVSRALLHLTGWLPNSIILVGSIAVVSVALVWRFAEWVHSKADVDKQDFLLAAAAKS